MKKLITLCVVLMVLLPLTVKGQTLVREYRNGGILQNPLEIEVWVDNEDGIYYNGEDIIVYFQASLDCYASIYSVDTRGNVNLLFPEESWNDGFIKGGETYSIPGNQAEYNLVVSGPEGIEHIQAVAAMDEIEIPRWYDGANPQLGNYEDPEDFITEINERYFNCRREKCPRAFDHTSVYVKSPQYYYKPVYVPSYWNNGPDYSMVYVDYPYGGEIYIDGIFIGVAPLWVPRMVWGWHWFTIYDRFGHCWENHVNIYDRQTFYFDRNHVKTSRSKVSRYKDIRNQTRKYGKSEYVLSEKRVKTTRMSGQKNRTDKYSRPGTRTYDKKGISRDAASSEKRKTIRDKSRSISKTKKSENKWNSWNNRKTEAKKSTQSKNKGKKSQGSVKRSGGNKSSGSKAVKSSNVKNSQPKRKSSGSSVKNRDSGKSTKSQPKQRSTPSKSKKKGGGSMSVTSSKSSGSASSSGGFKRSSSRGNRSSAVKSSPSSSSGKRSSAVKSSSSSNGKRSSAVKSSSSSSGKRSSAVKSSSSSNGKRSSAVKSSSSSNGKRSSAVKSSSSSKGSKSGRRKK